MNNGYLLGTNMVDQTPTRNYMAIYHCCWLMTSQEDEHVQKGRKKKFDRDPSALIGQHAHLQLSYP